MHNNFIHLMFRSSCYYFLALCVGATLLSADAVRAQTASLTPSASTTHQVLFPGLTGNELVDSLRVHFRPATVTSSYTEARDVLFADIHLDDTGTLTCVYTGDRLTHDPESGLTVRMYAQDNGWNTEHIWPQSLGAGSGNARIDMHHLRPIRADVNSSRSNYAFAFLDPEEVTRWWREDVNQTATPSGDLGEWSRTRSTSPARFEVRDQGKGDVARAMFYFYTMYPSEARSASFDYLYRQMDDLRSYHNIDPVDADELGWTWAIAGYQDDKPNPFVVDTTLIRRAYFEDYEQWDPSDVELDDPDAFVVDYTFAGTVSCDEENPWPVIPDFRVDGSAMQRVGVACNQGTGTFNSRLWATTPERSEEHYIHFTISAVGRPLDMSDGTGVAYQIRRSATGPDRFAWRVRIDGGEWLELDSGTLTGTSDFTREVVLAVPDEAGEGAGVVSGGASSKQSIQSLTPAGSVQTMEFRMYGWNAEGGGGTLRLNYITVDGRLGEPDETLGLLVPGEQAGWHLMSMPVGGVRFADLALQNQIQGIDGVGELYADEYPGIEFENGQAPNVLRYGAGYGGGWLPPEDIFETVASGTGFAWFFFNNDVGPSRKHPFELQVTGPPARVDVDAALSPGWNLMGNPFAGAIPYGDILYLDAQGNEQDAVGGVQIWDPELQSWIIPGPNETLAAWQGFFVEDHGADALRFRIDGASGSGISGSETSGSYTFSRSEYDRSLTTREQDQRNEKPAGERVAGEDTSFHLRFSLYGVDRHDGHSTADYALSLLFHPDAGPGYDRFDMRKLPPLTTRYAQAFFLLDGHGDDAMMSENGAPGTSTMPVNPKTEHAAIPMARVSRPVGEDLLALPLDIRAAGMDGTLTLRWRGMDAFPDSRRITLEDHVTGTLVDLRTAVAYDFELDDRELDDRELDDRGLDDRGLEGGELADGGLDNGAFAGGVDTAGTNPRFTLHVSRDSETGSGSTEPPAELPKELTLAQNYPNPFNPSTVISYALPEQAQVRLTVYDMLGRTVGVLVDEQQAPGRYDVTWDASNHSSGVYIYRIDAGGLSITRKMTLVR